MGHRLWCWTWICGPLASAAPLVGYANGAVTPALTPSVAAATADHLAAKGGLALGAAPALGLGYAAGYGYGLGALGAPLVGHPNGALVPAETADLVASREASLAALAAGGDGRAPNAPNFAPGVAGLVADGPTLVPADTAEVAAAKADFLATFNMMNMPGADK